MTEDEMGWHAERMGDMRNICKILVGTPEEWNHLEDLGVDGNLIAIKRRIICWLDERLLDSQERLCCMVFVSYLVSLLVSYFINLISWEYVLYFLILMKAKQNKCKIKVSWWTVGNSGSVWFPCKIQGPHYNTDTDHFSFSLIVRKVVKLLR
jgi:hypothetical protein